MGIASGGLWAAALCAVLGGCATTKVAGSQAEGSSDTELQAWRILEQHRKQGEFPGAVIALRTPQGESVLVTDGTADPTKSNAPVDANTPWMIGSATKTFVAIVVLQLAQEEKLDLDASIEGWFPDLPGASQITTRQLLQHTSGLNEYLDSQKVLTDAKRRWLPKELVAAAVELGPLAEPGARHNYSNTNYILLGGIIERVTSKPWYAEVRARISEPLGLAQTGYGDEVSCPAVGPGYGVVDGDFVEQTAIWHRSLGGAAGGLQSTAKDLIRLAMALLNGQLLDDRHNAEMRTFVKAQSYGHVEHDYGLGLERYRINNITMIGHLGSASAHGSFVGYDPDRRIVVATLINSDLGGPPAMMAAEAIGAITDRSVASPPMPSASAGYTYFPYADLDDANGAKLGQTRITTQQASISHRMVFNEDRTQVEVGLDFQRLRFDYKGFVDNPTLQSVNSLSLNVSIIQKLTDSWGLLLIGAPGYNDDFLGPASLNALTLTLIGAGTYRFNPDLEIGLGLAMQNIFGEPLPLPVASVEWTITPQLWLSVILPVKAELTWLPIDQLGLRAGLLVNGNTYHGDPQIFGVANPQLNYSAIALDAGLRWFILPWLHVTPHAGYTLYRRLELSDGRDITAGGEFTLKNGPVFGLDLGIGG